MRTLMLLLPLLCGCSKTAPVSKPEPLPPPPVVTVEPFRPACPKAGPQPMPVQPRDPSVVEEVLRSSALTLGDAWTWMEIACLRAVAP